jgi:invasion protein IalB
MRFSRSILGIMVGALLWSATAAGQTAPKASGQAAPAPDRTTASFGDWVLRCDRRSDVTPAQRFCEVGQTIQRPGDSGPQAQVGLGKIQPTDPIRITVLLPINVSLQPAVKIITDGPEAQTIELAWQRCLPTGCFTNAVLSDEVLKKLRVQKDGGRLDYRDGGNREVNLPISFRGFGEAWEAFLRETSN